MPKKSSKKESSKRAAPVAALDAGVSPLDGLLSLARRHPKAVESIEFALDLGILAAQALRQLAVGIREGSHVVARRHRAGRAATAKRKRSAA